MYLMIEEEGLFSSFEIIQSEKGFLFSVLCGLGAEDE